MGSWLSRKIFGPPAPNLVKGVGPRIKNCLLFHTRGVLGFFLTLLVCLPLGLMYWSEDGKPTPFIAIECMWYWMLLFFLLQPVDIPCTAMIPIFILPVFGILSTVDTAKCYFNEGICLFILASMLLLLWNNSGFDRRLALWILTSGQICDFTPAKLVCKCSVAAYFLSMFSNRLIATATLTEYITPILLEMQAKSDKKRPKGAKEPIRIQKDPKAQQAQNTSDDAKVPKEEAKEGVELTFKRSTGSEPSYDEIRYIVNNAIQTSASIGSIAIVHSACATLLFRAVWSEPIMPAVEYPDIFNYLEYSLFAAPLSLGMFVINCAFHSLFANSCIGSKMPIPAMEDVRNRALKLRDTIPKKCSVHEKLSVFFSFFALLILFLRWNKYQRWGWADYNLQEHAPEAPFVRDASVVAIFVIGLHVLPKSINFLQILSVEKVSHFKRLKPESGILWWRYCNQNTNYGYFFLFGAAIALDRAIKYTGFIVILSEHFGRNFTDLKWNTAMFVICLITCLMANVMSGVAVVVCLLPLILNINGPPADIIWGTKLYLPVLGVGIGASMGFILPFINTPAYYCHHTGKVPIKKMFLYSFLSVWACLVLLWMALIFLGPALWDPRDYGITAVMGPFSGKNVPTTTAAVDTTAEGGEGGGEEP